MAFGKASSCTHPRPHTEVTVRYFVQLSKHVAVIRMTCPDCGTPFKWTGPSKAEGYSLTEPVVSEDGLELRAPLEPVEGHVINPGAGGRVIGVS